MFTTTWYLTASNLPSSVINLAKPLKGKENFLKRLNIELLHDSAIPLLGKYSKELKTEIQTNAGT